MNKMLLIARREYLEQIRGRGFRLSTIGLPALFAIIIGIGYFASLGLGGHKHLVIAANDSALAAQVRSRLLDHNGSNTTVDIVPSADANARADLIRQIHAESIDGLLSIDAQPGALPTATYTSRSAGDFQTNGRLRNAVNDGIVANHLALAGMAPDQRCV